MLGGVAVYGVMSSEQRVFEQELVRRQRLQEAKQAVKASEGITSGGISKLAASIRALVRSGSSTEQVPAGA
jgi:hypothetical protein